MLNHISSGFILIIFVIRYFYNNILNIREYKNIFFVDKFFFFPKFFFLRYSIKVFVRNKNFILAILYEKKKKKEIRKFPFN